MIIILISYICFRSIGFDSLQEIAQEATFMHRGDKVTEIDSFIVPHEDGVWGKKAKINKEAVTLAMAGFKTQPKGPNADERL